MPLGELRQPSGASLSSELQRLIALQEVDSALQRIGQELELLPRREEETGARQRRAQQALDAHRHLLQGMALERREGEKEVESLSDQERKFQGKTAGVRTNEELWALQKEIRTVRDRRSVLETAVLEAMEREDAARARLAPLEKDLAEAERQHAENRARLAEERRALEARLAERRSEREARVSELPPALRARYERVLAAGRTPAVVPLSKNACGGCYTAQPPQRVQEVRRGEFLVVCEFCGRLLVGVRDDGS